MSVRLTVRQEPMAPDAFARRVQASTDMPLRALSIRTVQLNVGLRCNLSCGGCHVGASPLRKELMKWEIMQLALKAARSVRAPTIDITGGEPVLHPQIHRLIEAARAGGFQVILRTNLAILAKPPQANLPEFLKKNRVRLVGTLPSLEESIVDAQRGRGVFRASIAAIQKLNNIGYGIEPTLPLDLIHHPHAPLLPPAQSGLELQYKRVLDERFGIRFTQLFTIINMPVGRYRQELQADGRLAGYLQKLQTSFNLDTLDGLMCRHQLHVAWDGTLYDCDYNCALKMPVQQSTAWHIRDFNPTTFLQRQIATADHCFGCTAARGSSWSGELV